MSTINRIRRRLLQQGLPGLLGLGGAALLTGRSAKAHHTDTHFEDDTAHKVVYQLNKADHDYIEHVLFSCGELLRKYGDDIMLVIVCFGPGLQLLGKKPTRPIDPIHQQRVKSLMDYGVKVIACGNTMKALQWSESDLLYYSAIEEIGADVLMQLQEQGYSYISW